MKLLKSLSKAQVATILGIVLLVIMSLWMYERYDSYLQDSKNVELVKENNALRYEIDNLKKQNQLLHKVLELKKDIK